MLSARITTGCGLFCPFGSAPASASLLTCAPNPAWYCSAGPVCGAVDPSGAAPPDEDEDAAALKRFAAGAPSAPPPSVSAPARFSAVDIVHLR